MKAAAWLGAAFAVTILGGAAALAADSVQKDVVERSKAMVLTPPWPAGDERGMANTLGPGTWARCAHHMGADGAQSYELSHERSNTMPMSPFGSPLEYVFGPTVSLPGTRHAFNGEQVQDIDLSETGMKDRPLKGHISIQDHGLPMQVRNVRIREIE